MIDNRVSGKINKEMMSIELQNNAKNKLALVIGVGGGGCNALQHIYSENKSDAIDFFAINTDIQALNNLKIPLQQRLLIGENLTEGRGAGANPSQGELAAIESLSIIKQFLKKNYKIVFILAGMGGGTGTGASPIIAKACKELDILTIAVLSTPFTFEGNLRQKQARQGINALKKYTDSIFLFSNDNILNYYSTFKLSEAFKYSDSIFKLPIDLIVGITTTSGYINIDFQDIKTVLAHSGFSTVTMGTGIGEKRAKQALEQILQSPFISNVNLNEVKDVLIQVVSGKKEVVMDEIAEVTDYFSTIVNNNADIIWGTAIDTDLDEELKINAILSGVKEEEIIEYSNPTEIEIEKNIPTIIEKEVRQLRQEYEGKKIAFLIMQFGKGKLYDELLSILQKSLGKYDIVVLRADNKEYHDNLYYNILTYIYASDFGIAVFERIQDDYFNPNVAFEVGFMLGINKQVCHLKEKSLKHLHTDIIGKLYREFDIQDIENTLVPNLDKWINDKNIK